MVDFKNKKLLVIAPHPDDEVLGAAGLIQKVKQSGGKVYVLFMTVGDTKDFSKSGKSTSRQRIKEIEKVAKFLKFDDYAIAFEGDDYHLKLDDLPQLELIQAIESGPFSINSLKPDIVVTPQVSDYNQDHRATAEAVISALRSAPKEFKHSPALILGSEFAPSANWGVSQINIPNFFISLTEEELKVKVKAMDLYSSQKRGGAHSRGTKAIKSLAYLRGTQSGFEAAEAFFNYRTIV